MRELNEKTFYEFIKNEAVLIDFWAPWCAPCIAMSPILEEIERETGISVGKVNTDENMNLAREFGIMSIPSIILFSKGREVGRMVGSKRKDEIKEWIQSLIFSP